MKREFIMQSENDSVEVIVCLGSSCFARGNSENLDLLKSYERSHEHRASIHLTGCLCQDQCRQSPNLKIGGRSHHGVTADGLHELLDSLDKASRGSHAAS